MQLFKLPAADQLSHQLSQQSTKEWDSRSNTPTQKLLRFCVICNYHVTAITTMKSNTTVAITTCLFQSSYNHPIIKEKKPLPTNKPHTTHSLKTEHSSKVWHFLKEMQFEVLSQPLEVVCKPSFPICLSPCSQVCLGSQPTHPFSFSFCWGNDIFKKLQNKVIG